MLLFNVGSNSLEKVVDLADKNRFAELAHQLHVGK